MKNNKHTYLILSFFGTLLLCSFVHAQENNKKTSLLDSVPEEHAQTADTPKKNSVFAEATASVAGNNLPVEPTEDIEDPVVTASKPEIGIRSESQDTAAAEEKQDNAKGPVYLGEYLAPWEHIASKEPVEFLFENAELSTLLQYVEQKFNVVFILDDSIQPLPQGGKSIMGTKISFKTHKPLSRKDAWNLFVTFLDMAGLAPVPGPGKNVYKLMPSQDPKAPRSATHSPLPTFIGVDPSLVPNSDIRIRYIYFVENSSLDVINGVFNMMKSVSSPELRTLPELNAIIVTDKATNIKAMLAVVKELDQANMPESLAVIKLKRTDAVKAAKLYESLIQKGQEGLAARLFSTRKAPTSEYFSEFTRVIPEPRTNSLIVLGSRESIKKITDFIVTIVDQQDTLPEVPLYIYKLKYLDSATMAGILTEAVKFQANTAAGKAGGVRDGDKYLKPVFINAEPTTNSLIINADYEDYSKIYDLLKKLDIEQPQVALKVFILNVDVTDSRALGIQLRNKIPGVNGLIGNDTNFQTSGLAPNGSSIVENKTGTGATRLLGDLISLATGVASGSTVVSLGSDRFGVWGILNMLETYTKTTLVANPFLVTTHKYPAQFTIGEKRYVISSTVFGAGTTQNTFEFIDANLTVSITPQISKDGLITLDSEVILDQFTDANPNSTNGNRTSRRLKTSVVVADNEVLALGGLIRETTRTSISKVPVLGSIPLLGWLFKNKSKSIAKLSLLILIIPEIITPNNTEAADDFTQRKTLDAKDLIMDYKNATDNRDPINRWFFNDQASEDLQSIDNFSLTKNRYTNETNSGLEKKIAPAATVLEKDQTLPTEPMNKKAAQRLSDEQKNQKKKSITELAPD